MMNSPINSAKKLSIIIHPHNEGKTIHHILDRVKAIATTQQFEKELIIVDDFSKDNTADVIEQYQENS